MHRHLRAVKHPERVGLQSTDIASQVVAEGVGNVALYMVLLQEDPYAEAREMRLRTRYAVASALGEVGYKPRDNRRLGLWRRSLGEGQELRIAFEWFDAMDTQHVTGLSG